jgi:hypothetical protein
VEPVKPAPADFSRISLQNPHVAMIMLDARKRFGKRA